MFALSDNFIWPFLIAVAALGVGIGVYSLRLRRKVRNLTNQAAQAIEQGRKEEALHLLVAAEHSWSMNAADGSRKSMISAFDDYGRILSLLTEVSAGREYVSQIARLQDAVGELRAMFDERANFGIDGRSMKREVAVRWVELVDRFKQLREELRRSLPSQQLPT